jgi:hypothetical protein
MRLWRRHRLWWPCASQTWDGVSSSAANWGYARGLTLPLSSRLLLGRYSEGHDGIPWVLEPSWKFSVKSLYRKLCQGTLEHFSDIWKVVVPMKVRIFLWQLVRKHLPSNDNINCRRGPLSGRCAFCADAEDTAHIFFLCSLARFMRSAVREQLLLETCLICGCVNPR